MSTVRLSTKGQVVIPKPIREELGWRSGQRLEVTSTSEGVLLRPEEPARKRSIDEVAGMLRPLLPRREPVSIEEQETGVKEHIRRQWRDFEEQ